MLNVLLTLLAGCSPELSNSEAGLSARTADKGCDAADRAAASVREEAAILEHRMEVVARAADNYAVMWGLAVRAGSGATAVAERSSAAGEFAERLVEAGRMGMEEVSVSPASFGLRGARIDHVAQAAAYSAKVAAAVDALTALVNELEGEHNDLIGAESSILASWPECRDGAIASVTVELVGSASAQSAFYRNTSEARALTQAAGGADVGVGIALDEMHQLALDAANEELGVDQREAAQARAQELAAQVDRIGAAASFNEIPLGDGRIQRVATLVSVGEFDMQIIMVELVELSATALGIDEGNVDLSTAAGASAAIDAIELAEWRIARHEAAMVSIADVLSAEIDDSAAPVQ